MAPILEDIEQPVSMATGLDIEVPSYVDDIMACVLDKDGVENMKEVLKEVDKVVGVVAAKWALPTEAWTYKIANTPKTSERQTCKYPLNRSSRQQIIN